MGKIMKAYEGKEEQPSIETTTNAFKIILPNINAKYELGISSVSKMETATNADVQTKKNLSDKEEKILEYTQSHGAITRSDVIELLDVSTSTASSVISKMIESKLLKRNGKARNTNYTII